MRWLACSLAWTTAALLAFAALHDGGLDAMAALIALFAGWSLHPPATGAIEVAIDRHGCPALRGAAEEGASPERAAQCVFAASWLITLRQATMWVPVWPDAVPGNSFRRLWVHIRWGCVRLPAEPPARSGPE